MSAGQKQPQHQQQLEQHSDLTPDLAMAYPHFPVEHLLIYLSIYLSIDPSIHPSIHPSIDPSIHLSTYLSSYLYSWYYSLFWLQVHFVKPTSFKLITKLECLGHHFFFFPIGNPLRLGNRKREDVYFYIGGVLKQIQIVGQ